MYNHRTLHAVSVSDVMLWQPDLLYMRLLSNPFVRYDGTLQPKIVIGNETDTLLNYLLYVNIG